MKTENPDNQKEVRKIKFCERRGRRVADHRGCPLSLSPARLGHPSCLPRRETRRSTAASLVCLIHPQRRAPPYASISVSLCVAAAVGGLPSMPTSLALPLLPQIGKP
ncbi:Neisseria PilC protein [Sesbania bispinosa]|nr:Neisseria PilC protein [Sesbania bispinosa]